MKNASRSTGNQSPKAMTPEGREGVTREVAGLFGDIRPRPAKREGWDL
jgi:hypothetical protein